MITPYDYQREALRAISDAFRTKMAILVVMATGLGKTVVSALWAKDEIGKGHKGLFLCHDNGILDQAIEEFRKALGGSASLAAFYGSEKERDYDIDNADVAFASFQTMRDWKEALLEDEFDFVIVDESHHGQAPTFKDVIGHFKPKKLFGMTGTPDREDMKDIREIFGEEVVDYPLEEAIARGWLASVEYHVLNDGLSHWKLKKILKEVLEDGKRISIKQLNETIFVEKRDDEIAARIMEFSGPSRKTIVFCERIEHAENFQRHLPDSITYHSKVKGGKKELRKRLADFREGKTLAILAVDKFNEGIDIPDAEVVCFLRCTDSKTVFFQQLGRGLRKTLGKEKVVVLDFVANCERLAMVKEMAQQIKGFAGNHSDLTREKIHVSGVAFDFVFSDDQIDIFDMIQRINEPFYDTWQEASDAAIALGIKNQKQYGGRYKIDPKLPSNPCRYPDFPGWAVFLGGEKRDKKDFYPNWQEASRAAKKLNFEGVADYRNGYKKDQRLSSIPHILYPDFPGWRVFLGKGSFYETWQEASTSAINLGFSTIGRYIGGYKSDPKLVSCPDRYYQDFPGWKVFLGKDIFYKTWQEASAAARVLGLSNIPKYIKGREKDPKLPGSPNSHYKDFPGWKVFFDRFYSTWEEASSASIGLGICTPMMYRDLRENDSKLPSHPNSYYADFPGWAVFLGRKKKTFYGTWKEASVVAIGLGFTIPHHYRKDYKKDSHLPSDPDKFYSDFPGWNEFLGKVDSESIARK